MYKFFSNSCENQLGFHIFQWHVSNTEIHLVYAMIYSS
jgi:hypothetical protein